VRSALPARATRTAVLTAGLVAAVCWCLPLLAGFVLHGLDLTRVDVGTACAVRAQRAHEAGWWLSWTSGAGAPLFAEPSNGLLYPARWLAWLLPDELGASLFAVAHVAGGAAATAWLARTYRVRPALAVGAGLAFAASGPVVDLPLHTFYVVAATWLPFSWAAARRGRGDRVALGVAACALGGDLQGCAIACAVVALAAPARRRVAVVDRAPCALPTFVG
jgi:hypothetical protein